MKAIALMLALLVSGACASALGGRTPQIPMSMPDRCDFHTDWQCRNTEKWLKCSMNEQCIKDNDIAI